MDEPVKHSEARRKILNHNSLTGESVFLPALAAPEAQPSQDPPLPSSNEAGDAQGRVTLGDHFKEGSEKWALPSFTLYLHFYKGKGNLHKRHKTLSLELYGFSPL